MFNKTKSLIIIIILLLSINILTNVNALPSSEHFITPDGKYIYIDDDKAYLKATYHVTHGQAIEHSVMTKQYTGDCDFAIGFDGEVAWPKKVLLDDPHYVYWNTENTETFYYVSNFEQTEEPQNYGNSYNPLKYKFDHRVLTDVGDPDGPVWMDVYDTVAYFDSQVPDGNNYTVTWETINSQFEQYTDISDRILSNPIEYEFDGKNLWYVTKNIHMTAGEMRNITIEMDSKIEFGENSYKYDIIWKPSHQTISEANAAGNLFILDPYWNTSWNNRFSNQLPDGKRPYLYSLNISNDAGTNNATHIFGNGSFNSNYSDIVMAFDDGTIIQHAIEDNSSDPTILWANVTTNGTVHIYFNNSEAVDSSDYSGIVSGGVVSGSNGKIIQSFLSNGSFSAFDSFDVEYLVVAGGGGGGTNTGGGGGAGGLLYNVSHAVSLQTYDIKVGAGGVKDDNGGNSVFSTLTAIGGGGGQGGADGLDGGSGGGAGHYATWDGGSGVAGQGHDGGNGVDYNSGGGGGAGQVGYNADSANSGDGGIGLAYSISGSSTYYAGGGGGGADSFRDENPGNGGLGGGGNGGDNAVGYPGTANTGGGGGGGSNRPNPMAGGTGGSGIVIISYDKSGTWSTWSETQYYTDSLHYNATSPYNFTIESDSTLTSNRSIIPADDTNDTAQSTGTSYLILNVFDNDATIVRNFTISGDNLDWYQVADISGTYDLKNSSGIIETQSNGNFTTNLIAGTYWIEEEEIIPTYIPPNATSLASNTGKFWVNHTWSTGVGADSEEIIYLITGDDDGTFTGYNWTGSTWQSDTAIISDLPDVGLRSKADVFEKDGTTYLISGEESGIFNGYRWIESTWSSYQTIVNELPDVGTQSNQVVFQMDSTWYLIAGELDGVFNGFNWTGTTWQSDTGIISGLVDVGQYSNPDVFQMDGTWYLISGEADGVFNGYNWTGSTWQSDSAIISGLVDVGIVSDSDAFQIDSTWYLIAGNYAGNFAGYNWTGSTWQSDSAIKSGLSETGTCVGPTVFAMSEGEEAVNNTDSFNVSVNDVWYNTTTDLHFNDTYSAHEWQNITVWAYNSSGSGTLSAGSVSDNKQIPNNVPVLSGVSASYNLYENETLTIDADHTDADSDTITYSDNASEWDINPSTGEVSWVLDWEDVAGSPHSYRITIDDGYGGTDYQDFTVTINGAQNTALTSVDTSFENGFPGTDYADNVITLSFYLINSGSIDADISAKFTTDYESTYGLVSGTSTIPGSNFKLGNATLDALLDNGNSVDLTDSVPGEVTRRNYEVQLRVPAGQSALAYSGTIELTFSDAI